MSKYATVKDALQDASQTGNLFLKETMEKELTEEQYEALQEDIEAIVEDFVEKIK